MTPMVDSKSAGRPISSIQAGDSASLKKAITAEDIQRFAEFSGDFNPLHIDAEYAGRTRFQKPVAHGMILASCVSTLVGMHLPGPGALWIQQSFRWLAPVFAGDVVEVTLRVVQVSTSAGVLKIKVDAVNQSGKKVMDGEGSVMALQEEGRSI